MLEFYLGKKIDVSLVQAFEKKFGIKFPQNYVNMVLENDGAYMNGDNAIAYHDPGLKRKDVNSFSKLHNFNRGQIEYMNSGKLKHLPQGIIFFGLSGGDDQFGFDYREKTEDEPPVILFLHHNQEGKNMLKLADTFDEFLGKLYNSND